MTTTTVGMRCPECSKQRTKVVRMRDMAAVPRVTYALIAVNVLAFLFEGNLTVSGQPGASTAYDKGALLGSFQLLPNQGVAHGQWWRLLTSGFLHENILHVGMNMLVLYWLGRMLEPAIGSVRFAAVYMVSLLAGSFGALLLTPHSFTVGASGAIFGLAGCAVVEMRSRNIPIMQSGLGTLIVINLLFSFSGGISIGGHIGGLVGGAIAGLALQLAERRNSLALALLGSLVIGGGFFAAGIFTARSSDVSAGAGAEQQLVIPGGSGP
jgi:membrane associated rhomboid family serine protease